MATKYQMIRLPVPIYKKYFVVKRKMEDDLTKINNRPVSLSMPQFFDTLISCNENWIEIDLNRLNNSFIGRRRRY